MKKLSVILLTVLLVVGCDILDFDESINNNPNSPSQASADQLISNAMLSLPGVSSNTEGEFLAQYLAETQYVVVSRYPNESTSFYGWYQGPLINLQTVLDGELSTPPSENQIAVAKILKAYYFWFITDRWGDVPMSESLQGGENITPKYDTQKAIYDANFALLREAADQIDTGGSIPSDLVYGGDMTKWKKLANSLRMLMALRLSNIDEPKASAEFSHANGSDIMSSNDDNFAFQHLADANNQSYWYGQVEESGREWWALTEGLVDLMKPSDDPRLPVYGDPARNGGDYVGLAIGSEPAAENTEDFSLLGEKIREQDSKIQLVTYAQILFAKAEASELNWISEDVETNYNKAIEQSLIQWTGDDSDYAAFIAQPDITFDGGNAIEQIATQRYVHLFMHGFEAWAEYRRTGFPAMALSDGNEVPRRQSYTETEAFNNEENYNEAIQRQFSGSDDIYDKIWWDN